MEINCFVMRYMYETVNDSNVCRGVLTSLKNVDGILYANCQDKLQGTLI